MVCDTIEMLFKGENSMHQDVKEILYSLEDIQKRSQELGKQISEDYAAKTPILLGLLKGSVPFMAELSKWIEVDVTMDFMHVSSYNGVHSETLNIKKDMEQDVRGKDVLIIEDIIDTGNTLFHVKELLLERGASSVKIVALLDKAECRTVDIQADYVGFVMPNAFAIGFGLDFNEKYRNLPYVGILKEECYQ